MKGLKKQLLSAGWGLSYGHVPALSVFYRVRPNPLSSDWWTRDKRTRWSTAAKYSTIGSKDENLYFYVYYILKSRRYLKIQLPTIFFLTTPWQYARELMLSLGFRPVENKPAGELNWNTFTAFAWRVKQDTINAAITVKFAVLFSNILSPLLN